MNDDKYIVFKREDWLRFASLPGAVPEEVAINDAVVIRKQDIFAGPALHAYASSIQTSIEILEAFQTFDGGGYTPNLDRLREVRDYFFAQANDADKVERKKMPD